MQSFVVEQSLSVFEQLLWYKKMFKTSKFPCEHASFSPQTFNRVRNCSFYCMEAHCN